MKLTSIRNKVIAAMSGCLTVGLAGMLALMHYSFTRSANVLAEQSLTGARNLFAVSEAREIGKMAALTELLNANPEFGNTLLKQDREHLIEITAPLFLRLKGDGITNWTFHTPQPNMAPFLRLHNPGKYGDRLDRYIDQQVSTSMTLVTGNEFGRAGFALRTISPLFAAHGEIAGYVEFGQELGEFLHQMKAQTGDNYGLLLNKKLVNRQFWADSSAFLNRRDDWDDAPTTVLLDKTSTSNQIVEYDGDLSTLPKEGKVLERFREGKSVFVRGVFPVEDAQGQNVGAIFVVRDISAFYAGIQRTEIILALLAVVGGLATTAMFLIMLNRLIFRRLDRIIRVATRVVGGDYATEIKVSSEDEVGQFENLFEMFRRVFVDVLSHVPELQRK